MSLSIDTLADRVMGYVEEAAQLPRQALVQDGLFADVMDARALFVWAMRHLRPELPCEELARFIGVGTVTQYHLRAVRLRLDSARFMRWCEDFEATMRSNLEVPHGCA